MLRQHRMAWHHLWERYRVSMRGGRGRALQVIRLHLFHVLQTISEHSVDLDVGVPARGLHGEAYRGHVLWDELFVFPLLNLHAAAADPGAAALPLPAAAVGAAGRARGRTCRAPMYPVAVRQRRP